MPLETFAEKFLKDTMHYQSLYHDYEYPKVSIVIPSYNCSQSISVTLESLLNQNYPDYEIIIIDADSTDHTRDVILRYRSDRVIFHGETKANRYELMNKGIEYAQGEYINFLFPGDFYVGKETLKVLMALALTKNKPDLVYCGALLRDGKSEVKILSRPLSVDLLRRGQQPTSLQSCWFKVSSLYKLGKFDTSFRLRGGFDLLCRFCANSKMRFESSSKVLTDYDLRWVSKPMITRHFVETWRIIFRRYGFFTLVRWIFIQKDIKRLLSAWLKSVKLALMGR